MAPPRKNSLVGLFLLGGFIISHAVWAQPRHTMRPSLVAIQVENLDNSIEWYKNNLEFKVVDRQDFKEHGLRLAILELGDFKLELVDNDKAFSKNIALQQNGVDDMTGFAKVTFTIDQVNSFYEKLKNSGANFAIALRDSNTNSAERFFIVLDCDRNWLQFIGPK